MRKAGAAFLLVAAAACGNNENVFYGSIGPSTITPFIAFDNANSVISGRATLTDADGGTTGSAELVIISDRPRLCDRLVFRILGARSARSLRRRILKRRTQRSGDLK